MTEAFGDGRGPLSASNARGRDDATAPFVLDRSSARPPPLLPEQPLEATAEDARDRGAPEHDGEPVLELVSRRSEPDLTAVAEVLSAPASPTAAAEDARRLDRPGRRAARLLASALLADAIVLLALALTSLARLTREGAGAPDLLIGGVSLALALPSLLGAHHLARVGRRGAGPTHDAHRFAQGIGHLRAVFVLKATVLFATLGLGCFAFSLAASILALL